MKHYKSKYSRLRIYARDSVSSGMVFGEAVNFLLLLFIYFWLRWVFVAAHGLSLVALSGGYSSLQCVGFSLRWLLLLSMGSRHAGFGSCGTWALVHRLSSCGPRG